MSGGFVEVERPSGSNGSGMSDELIKALVATMDSGKAIRLPMKKTALTNWQSNVRSKLRRLTPPLRLKYRHDSSQNTLTCWTELMDGDDKEVEDFGTEGAPEEA